MEEIQEVVVLNEAQYKALEGKVIGPCVNNNTTELQAGYMLGVQAVLKLLREGYVAKTRRG